MRSCGAEADAASLEAKVAVSDSEVQVKRWRDQLSPWIRERVLQHYLVPYSRFGLPPGLVPHLPTKQAVTLVDVGANRGEFTSAVQAHCGVERAVLVEPQSPRCPS